MLFSKAHSQYCPFFAVAKIILLMFLLLPAISYAQITSVFTDASLAPKNITTSGDAILSNGSFIADGVSGSFDGDGDYLTVSPNPLPGTTNVLTIEAWIYMDSVTGYGWPIVSQTVNVGSGEQEFFISGPLNAGGVSQASHKTC
jgi:hypothetical protein